MTRNVFDQYKQHENRLTHALFASLSHDERLLRRFLVKVVRCARPLPRDLIVKEQHLPGEPATTEEDADQRGLPDAWIYGDDSWSVLVESKLNSPLRADQLRRHVATAHRRGFNVVRVLVIELLERPRRTHLPPNTQVVTWKAIYRWLRNQTDSQWAALAAEYFEVAEIQMTEAEYLRGGTLTQFTGFSFGENEEYGYLEAKRQLGLAMEELRRNLRLAKELGADLDRPGRPAITGKRGDSVWDFIPLKGSAKSELFTRFPHLTLSVQRDRVLAHVTFPYGMRSDLRRNLIGLGEEGFIDIIREVERGLRRVVRGNVDAAPWFVALQRHYRTQRSPGTIDALLEFDLRTALDPARKRRSTRIRPQNQWARIAFDVLANRKSNYQTAVGAIFPYRANSRIRTESALDLIAGTWIACRPILKAALGR